MIKVTFYVGEFILRSFIYKSFKSAVKSINTYLGSEMNENNFKTMLVSKKELELLSDLDISILCLVELIK